MGLRSSEKGWNASFLTGNKTKTLCLDQQMHIGTGIWTAFGNYLIVQIDTRGVSNSTFAVHCEQSDVDLTICVYFTRILTALQILR